VTRIIAGSAGGRRLRTPPGAGTRPTTDRVREALFSSLGDLTGLQVLDLYAGSGALGLEALSRGATGAVFVESDPAAAALIRTNLDALGLTGGRVVAADVEWFLAGDAVRYDVVLADPPYAADIEPLLREVPRWLAGYRGRVVIERSTRSGPLSWPAGIEAMRSRAYGETTLLYGRSL